mgnify:CR=1 FL=1
MSWSCSTWRLILTILPVIKRLDVPLIALTGNGSSTLSRYATVTLDVSVPAEACPLDLAPTASTTASLAMGDALAVACYERRGFTAKDFAHRHPGARRGPGAASAAFALDAGLRRAPAGMPCAPGFSHFPPVPPPSPRGLHDAPHPLRPPRHRR